MKHPICPPEYTVHKEDRYYAGGHFRQFIVIHRLPKREVAQLDDDGKLWEVWGNHPGENTDMEFPSLDAALQYVETKMALGILGEKE